MSPSNIILALALWIVIGVSILGMYNNNKKIDALQEQVVKLQNEKIQGWGNPTETVSTKIKEIK